MTTASHREVSTAASPADPVLELERLRRAERRKDEFLGQLAHEVGNVLVPLPLALEILKQPDLNQATIHRVCGILEQQAVCVQRLIGQIRSVSRLTRGVVLDRRAVDLQPIVSEAVAAIQPLAAERRHALTVALPQEPVRLWADPDRLKQVVECLLRNAIDYTDPGGRIRLEAAVAADHLVLRVEDNGRGIDPDLLPEIFEPFVRQEGAIEWSTGRLGIGLSVARQYVQLHGGTIAAECAVPGQGSTFAVRLPLAGRAGSGGDGDGGGDGGGG